MEGGGHTRIRLPRGEVDLGAGGAVRVVLPGDRDERARARVFFERVASFGERHGEAAVLLAPASIEERDGALALAYVCPDTIGLAEAAAAWRDDLATRLPAAIALARAVAAGGLALARAGWGFLPLAPPLLRVSVHPAGRARWIALPPLAVSLASFTEADPETWALAPPEALLGDLGASTTMAAYTAGAVLHASIAGDLWPEGSPPSERFARLLRGRAGAVHRVREALAAALPKALAGEGAALAETAFALLDADQSRRASGEEILARLAAAGAALSAPHLAAGWEQEGQAGRALAVLEREAHRAPPEDVAWSAISHLAEAQGDLARAIEAGARALHEGGPHALRRCLALLGQLAAGGADASAKAALARGIALVDEAVGKDPGDAARLYLAHLKTRHLDRGDAARVRLGARFESVWCRALGALLEARTYLEAGQHARASRAARDGRALLEAAPGGGGPPGAYARAYLHLLDGIANFGAVDALSDPSFLRDAFGGFTRAIDLARALGTPEGVDLSHAGLGWLSRVRAEASRGATRPRPRWCSAWTRTPKPSASPRRFPIRARPVRRPSSPGTTKRPSSPSRW